MKFFGTMTLAYTGLSVSFLPATKCAFSQGDEHSYLANFDAINSASYSAVDDPTGEVPSNLIFQCKKEFVPLIAPTLQVFVQTTSDRNVIGASELQAQCGLDKICIIPAGVTLVMDDNLILGAMIVRGRVEWKDKSSLQNSFLCAGYVAIEEQGVWDMNLQTHQAWIYLKDNGAQHDMLRSRAFGAVGNPGGGDSPMIRIVGKQMTRTWSLLSGPMKKGDLKITLLHNPALMQWKVGDRIGIAPTEKQSAGYGQTFRISAIDSKGIITLNTKADYNFLAKFNPPDHEGQSPYLQSAEVVNLSRNIVITGDDFTHIPCDPTLPEAVPGEETSILGCRCSSFRKTCTLGLHTAHMNSGVSQIENVRVEKCGQRGIEGKYCLHAHKLGECPDCLFRNNAIENSHQRGIIIHSTHRSIIDNNVLYDVRGAGIYIEDGNEMHNTIRYNVVICNFPFDHEIYNGCTLPGTSNSVADTSDNQSGIFSRAATNNLIGNRIANSFNGMFLLGGGTGRGASYGKVCEGDARIGRIEGNTFHGHGRFGTYTIGFTYPKKTDQAVSTDGHNIDQTLCQGFDAQGKTRGVSTVFLDNTDYNNAFVGHYEAGDIQYNGHKSYDNDNLMYWKETKNFDNSCSAHITRSSFARGNMALPDQATFIIEDTVFGESVSFEANHHCNVGITGVLCMPQYILHHVKWRNSNKSQKWVEFQNQNFQVHAANQNHGGIFTLSPQDASMVMRGQILEESFFPTGFVSLVSNKFDYLLSLGKCVRSDSIGYGSLYDNGILCRVPLRALKLYSRGLVSTGAPYLKVEARVAGATVASQQIGYHQVGVDFQTDKQGYSVPIIPRLPDLDISYHLSLSGDKGDIPSDWVIEFSDRVVGNRWDVEYAHLFIQGRDCGLDGMVSSHHDRKFLWSGDEFMHPNAWGNHGACVGGQSGNVTKPPADEPKIDCSLIGNNGVLSSVDCPWLCRGGCDSAVSFCDCGSGMCQCKNGLSGQNCGNDICAAARCHDHGSCSARYLSDISPYLPVTSEEACVCDEGWSGPLCTFNPCSELGLNCSGHGKCVANGVSDAFCECDTGFSGDHCETNCDGICHGSYPYGCVEHLDGIMKYGCTASGGCNYLKEGEQYQVLGVCTFKNEQAVSSSCQCESAANDCQFTQKCDAKGICPEPSNYQDDTPCNSVPFGVCKAGLCVPSESPTIVQPTTPQPAPLKPNLTTPVIAASPCGCPNCTAEFLRSTVANGNTCGSRIEWLQTHQGGSKTEKEACIQIARDEFGSICGPICDPTRCQIYSRFLRSSKK